jgi:hypothetical protein
VAATDKDVLARIGVARQDRQRHAIWMDEILRLGMPTYRRIQTTKTADAIVADQDDLFDTELQTTMEDFSSDMISTFTPRYERWTSFEPAEDLDQGTQTEIADQLQGVGDAIFAELERSNYWDAAQECFTFWAVAAMGVAVSDMGPLNPLHFQPIELPDLLMERGFDGTVTGKWREMSMTEQELCVMWPDVCPAPKPGVGNAKKKFKVIEGCDRDFDMPGVEAWFYRVFVDGKQKKQERYEGAGSCPIIACRYRHQADSAWGPGPAHKATPVARTLDELAYMNLKALGRQVDPPFSYEEDGTQNFEAGIQPGLAYPRSAGSEPPKEMLPEIRFDALVFNQEAMRKAIKRALYQDRPEQPGQTPPTATQWIDEREWQTRRRELPRDRCVREWVIPIIQRIAWIKTQRGELPPVKLQGGRVINVRPISPLSKAKDLQDIQLAQQMIGMATQVGAAVQAGAPINAPATIANMLKTSKDRLIVLLTDQELAAQQAAAAAAQATGPAHGQPPPSPVAGTALDPMNA